VCSCCDDAGTQDFVSSECRKLVHNCPTEQNARTLQIRRISDLLRLHEWAAFDSDTQEAGTVTSRFCQVLFVEALHRRTLALRLMCLGMLVTFACAHPLSALNPGRSITQLAHQSWGEKEGYPGLTYAIAQTRDGYLWLGTTGGLYRFDGIHFEHYEPLAGDTVRPGTVTSLLALPDGSLWIGYATGGLSLLQNNRLKNFGEKEGVPGGAIRLIVRDHNGWLWVAYSGGLIRFDGHLWEVIGPRWNCPKGRATAVFVDTRGTVWAAIGNAIVYLKQASKQFTDTGEFALQAASFAEAPDGKIWMADTQMAVRPVGTPGSPRLATARCEAKAASKGIAVKGPGCNSAKQLEIQVGSYGILFDREGDLWISTLGDGLRRSRAPLLLKGEPIKEFSDALEHFTAKEGLTSDYCSPPFEDREGNIWVGTRDGLDEFRDTPLVPILSPTGTIQIAIAPDEMGYVWATTNYNRLARVYDDSMNFLLSENGASAPFRDSLGQVWFRGNTSLYRLHNGRPQLVSKFPTSSDVPTLGGRDVQIAGDQGGKLWAFVQNRGFFSLNEAKWIALETPPEVAKLMATSASTDSTGRIWFGFQDGTVVTLKKGTIVIYPGQETRLAAITSFSEHGSEMWIGGLRGLALFAGGRFRPVTPWDAESFPRVTGVVDVGDHGLWLSEGRGITRISEDEVSKAIKNPSYGVHYETFDSTDGLPGKTPRLSPYPTAIRGTDGRLWFVAQKGIAWIDPGKILKNLIPPPVHVTSVKADGLSHMNLVDLRLPPQTETIQIDYTALSLSLPDKVRFRYKLDTVDKAWQEPGTRREAYYDHLSPGRYRFQVIACNNDGVWNKQGDMVYFSVLPCWYQTSLFRAAMIAIFVFLVWAFYKIRVWQIAHALSERFDERLAERTRIAGDLHDTLLQTIDVSKLVAQDAASESYDDLKMRRALEKLSVWLEKASQEARAAVKSLRTSTMPGTDLVAALQLSAENKLPEGTLAATFSVIGIPREIHSIVRDEAYCIGFEAVRNAQAHSAGSLLKVELKFDGDLELRVRDNGVGMDSAVREHGKENHFGLEGMRERAANIGGKLTITSSPISGTEVVLVVPASIAFVDAKSHLRTRIQRLLLRKRHPRSLIGR
jgi:signal transduction histidine kinase/ligand-binding sensor domain-containing protein